MADKAGLWLRVSSGAQDEASQLPDVERWCEQHGYTVAERYVVHGKSAYKGRHDQYLNRALEDMKAGRIDVLVVWAADRIERRGAYNAFDLARRVHDAGGRIEYVREPHLNQINELSDINLAISATLAHQESKRKSERIIAKHASLRAAGSLIGKPPWGYTISKQPDGRKILVPTEEGRKYVPLIFQAAIEGKSLRQIAEWLDSENVATFTGGKRWNENFIGKSLLKNPVYYGERRNNGQLVTEPLVSASAWQEANAMVAARRRHGRGTTVHEKAFLAPVCGACYGQKREGSPSGMSPMYRLLAGYGKNRKFYYRCTGHGPQRKSCGAPMIPAKQLDAIVTESMLADRQPHWERKFIPGDTLSDEITRLRERGADAMRRGDYPAAMEILKQAGELEQRPRVKPHWEWAATGETEGHYFSRLSKEEQREYLLKYEIIAHMVSDEAGRYPAVTIVPKDITPCT